MSDKTESSGVEDVRERRTVFIPRSLLVALLAGAPDKNHPAVTRAARTLARHDARAARRLARLASRDRLLATGSRS